MVNSEIQLLMFLWFSATEENYYRISDRFGIAQTTAIKSVERICTAIINLLLPVLVRWPNVEEARKIMKSFSSRGLKKVIGAIDGTHIGIKAPAKNPENYVNRKGYHSLIL